MPQELLIGYGVMSALTFIVFGLDKSAARRGARRVPERRLHLLGLLGGWPGSLLAQSLFRHKRRKPSFQRVFWLLTSLHIALMLLWLYHR